MDDLITWLRAQLDEDERAARKAGSLCGCHPPAYRWQFGDTATDGRILVVDDPHPDLRRRISRRWNRSYDGLFMAEHIARHDPARVLAEVDAKRAIIDRCEYELNAYVGPSTQVALAYLSIKQLALPYAGRPGYREEWRP